MAELWSNSNVPSSEMSAYRGTLVCFLALLAVPVALRADSDRVMIGDDIFVGADEEIRDAVCIGCSIHIEGKVRDAVAIGGSIVMNGEAEQDVVAVGGHVQLGGKSREAVAVAGRLEISGEVERDAVSVLGGIKLAPGASIGGDAVSVLGGIDGLDRATVGGSVHESGAIRPVAVSGIVILLILLVFLALALLPFLAFITLSILGPRRVAVLHETISQRAGMCLLLGFGAWIASMFLPFVLFWLPPAEFVLGIAFFVIATVGYAGISYWVGRGLVKSRSVVATGVTGAILVTVIQFIPIVGWFIAWPIFYLLALGAAILSGFGTSVDWMLQRSEVDPVPRPVVR